METPDDCEKILTEHGFPPLRPEPKAQKMYRTAAIFCMGLWILLFTSGALIDSKPFRDQLTPPIDTAVTYGSNARETSIVIHEADTSPCDSVIKPSPVLYEGKFIVREAIAPTKSDTSVGTGNEQKWPWHIVADVGAALVIWTPTNIGLLCMLAAFIGGCASYNFKPNGIEMRIADAAARKTKEGEDALAKLKRRYSFMYESPFISMCRGFFAFLVLLAVWHLFEDTVFKELAQDEGQERYRRMAAVFSAVGFTMGFDPTRFEDLVDRLIGVVTTATPR